MREAIEGIRDAHNSGDVVQILRHEISDAGARIVGCVVGYSDTLALVNIIDTSLRIDGYSVIHVHDVTEIDFDYHSAFYRNLAAIAEWNRSENPDVSLESVRTMLTSVNENWPLLGVYREFTNLDTFDVGRVVMITDESLAINRVDQWASPIGNAELWDLAEITQVQFGTHYLQMLARVAGQA